MFSICGVFQANNDMAVGQSCTFASVNIEELVKKHCKLGNVLEYY